MHKLLRIGPDSVAFNTARRCGNFGDICFDLRQGAENVNFISQAAIPMLFRHFVTEKVMIEAKAACSTLHT